MAYRNQERIDREEKELEELEAEYRKQYGGENQEKEVDDNPLENPGPELPTLNKEEETWKKRHGDLRSYTSRQINDLNKQINELKNTLAQKEREANKLPTNKTEAEEWVKEYPDLARVLSTLIEQQTEYVKEDVLTVRQELEAERLQMAKERAFNAILKVHSDFVDLINDPKFQEWVEEQPTKRGPRIGQALYDALYVNETDAEAAIEAVNIYKQDMNASKPKKDSSSKEAATLVRKQNPAAPTDLNGKKVFLESEIEKMKDWEFEKLEDEIEAARREGRITYDISGAAR